MKTVDQPITIIIYGGTGDLAEHKLIPALFDLYLKKCLPSVFRIVGFSRKEWSHEKYREFMKKSIGEKGGDVESTECSKFLSKSYYQRGDIDDRATYQDLHEFLERSDDELGTCTNKIFYLAVPPALYETSFSNLASSGLAIPCAKVSGDEYWTRVLVEKPFGNNLEEAVKLDNLLGKLFAESQIFRIDHYLAKETIQNILTFRFANPIFEPLWNKEHIEKVEINFYEESGIRERGNFYDGIGALRDVGQNHILQMLALIAMEDPKELKSDAIRKTRNEVLKVTKPASGPMENYALRAQYMGFKEAKGILPDSTTETYFKLKVNVNNKRWAGVPFYLESGKALNQSKVEIIVTFKEKPSCICPVHDKREHKNKITFRIQPDEGINIMFWIKTPGFSYAIDEKNLSFNYESVETLPDAYERVLFDCIRGDQTLFTSTEEVQAQWGIITPIFNNWDKVPLLEYEQGANPDMISNNFDKK